MRQQTLDCYQSAVYQGGMVGAFCFVRCRGKGGRVLDSLEGAAVRPCFSQEVKQHGSFPPVLKRVNHGLLPSTLTQTGGAYQHKSKGTFQGWLEDC